MIFEGFHHIFFKVSVLTAIIKLGLKTLLECVRLQTFGRYGLQQMQVDKTDAEVFIQNPDNS